MFRPEAYWLRILNEEIQSARSELPLLPTAAAKALQLAQQPNVDLQEVLLVAEQDPALAARFISVANSALYYRGIPITSLRLAMVRLGAASARDIMYMAVLTSVFDGRGVLRRPTADIFRHSVLTARASRMVAEGTRIEADLCFLGGLLHDMGKVRCLRILRSHLKATTDMTTVMSAIDQIHARAGGALARHWRLPEELVQAIEQHHQPPTDFSSRNLTLTGVIAIGDALANAVTEQEHVLIAHPQWNNWFNQLSFDLGMIDTYLNPPKTVVQAV